MINEQFIQVKTKANFETELAAGNVKDTSIAFIEDEDQIWAKGKYYSVIPKDGHERQILSWKASGEAKWEDLANVFTGLEEILAYGVEWDVTVLDPHITRIGNMSLHKTLPIQSQLKGCIAQEDKVIYWLDENDWKWRKNPITQSMALDVTDGVYTITDSIFSTQQYDKAWLKIEGVEFQVSSIDTATTTATLTTEGTVDAGTYTVELGAVLNGYDGTVRVYCPNFYIKSVIGGDKRRVWLSTVKIDNSYTYQHEILVDAYRSTVLNTVPTDMGYLSTLPVNSAISVVNTNTYCRGGNNDTPYDQDLESDPFRTHLGKPRTFLARSNMRTYSRNAGSEMLSYEQYKNIFYWLWVVEYANFNSQEAYNEELTPDGYRQGGMGNGITDVDIMRGESYNEYCPLTPCGYGNDIGNGTGRKQMILPAGDSYAESTHWMPRWRGFDNPFGDISTNLDGVLIDAPLAGESDTGILPTCYIITDPNNYTDSLTGIEEKADRSYKQPYDSGYIKEWNLGDAADIVPSATGGRVTTGKCDRYWETYSDAPQALVVGGGAYDGTNAGLGAFNSGGGVSRSVTHVGFRSVSAFVSFSQD